MSPQDSCQQRVLIIDDEPSIRDSLAFTLHSEHYAVDVAGDGEEGLELARKTPPDLVLCDIVLPGMDGYGVLAQLRRDPRTSQIPVVFLTGRANWSDVRFGMEKGADDYLCKPVSRQELLAAIQTRLANTQRSSQLFHQRMEALSADIASTVSHELLTPMVGIIGSTEMLRSEAERAGVVNVKDITETIASSAGRLQNTIRHLLEYVSLRTLQEQQARLAQYKSQPPQDAKPVVCLAALRAAADEKRLGDVQLSVSPAKLRIPAAYLDIAVAELVSNALKFSRPGSLVAVGLASGQRHATLSVIDHGRGMSGDQIRSIGAFRQFERAQYEQQGLGLGLEIVRLIASFFDADLRIHSDPQTGTCVSLERLPLAAPSPSNGSKCPAS